MNTTTELKPRLASAVLEIPTTRIEPDPDQPRKTFEPEYIASLAESIKAEGLRQPVTLRANPAAKGHYFLIMGECRWRAHRLAGLQTIRAIVTGDCENDAKRFRAQVVENKGRRDMSLREDAFAAKRMTELGDDDEVVARTMCLSVYRMRNIRRMTILTDEVWKHIESGGITAGIAEFAMSRVPDEHASALLLRCVGKNRKQAAAIVGGFLNELNQSAFELACEKAGFTAKKDDVAKQIALQLISVSNAIGQLDSKTRFNLARVLGDDVVSRVPQTQAIQNAAAFLQRLVNHVNTKIEMAKG